MHYEKAFKEEAVCLSDEIGIKKASEQLGISYSTLAGWRPSKACYGENAYVGSGYCTQADKCLGSANFRSRKRKLRTQTNQ